MKLILFGCGKMGSALLEGWLEQGIQPQDIKIIEQNPEQRETLTRSHGIETFETLDERLSDFNADFVILAVKPQGMDEACQACKTYLKKTSYLSIAAGKTIAYYESFFGSRTPIIRVMPNTPAAIGRGMSVCVANKHVSDQSKDNCTGLMKAVGKTAWIDNEKDMDAVTALSGSGPAYIFLMAECLTEAGIQAGLAPDLSRELARETIAGAAELMAQSGIEAATLRQNVTSPGGTTAAALNVLMEENRLQDLITQCINAAAQRSKELSG